MFEALFGIDTILTMVLFILWASAAFATGRLARSKSRKQLLIRIVVCLVLLYAAELAVFSKVYMIWQLWSSFGWWFAVTGVVGLFPFLLPSAAIVAVRIIPWLHRLPHKIKSEGDQPLQAKERGKLSAPSLIVPVQAATLASLFGISTVFYQITPPVWGAFLTFLGLFAAGTLCLLMRQARRSDAFFEGTMVVSGVKTRVLRGVAVLFVISIGLSSAVYWSMQDSRLPDRMWMMGEANDEGGGTPISHSGHQHDGTPHSSTVQSLISVTELTGPRGGVPDRRFTLTARKETLYLDSGAGVEAWTFNGKIPGPELRIRQGELVEITLVNEDIEDGVTVHWHGLNIPNGEDGVAGVTQNAVKPGESYTYRFVADQVGTYWYHSHQQSSKQVRKGLFGPLVIEPNKPKPSVEWLDIPIVFHQWDTTENKMVPSLGTADRLQGKAVSPGTPVRLRLINADNWSKWFALTGTRFQVAAIDGNDIVQPTDLRNAKMLVAGGGRHDITFIMPETPVQLTALGDTVGEIGMVFSQDGSIQKADVGELSVFDPAAYGALASTPFNIDSQFDREFFMVFDNRPGFYDGQFDMLWTINGKVFPDTPMLMVQEGDLAKTTFVNRSFMDHPMHLHGHHMLVLRRNGRAVTGSPWWTDTLNVAPGETYEVAFRADNPGIWMDHCHNLDHAKLGMTLHLAYEGIYSPFEVGRATPNQPE
ncbi:multicopper oxidase family protein [Brevibacillus humidisoli]|uniref:multicopper oxidase family protein n=1 Tax=Brevibacillus humidisoli TaxID=2895522 RepID=UPI001E3DBD1E|nr:multicopper oxidase family protein [Brevibacillus humidisoli]UFJ40470.1 multicopper oxidase family protein [Brevibacillus humidisoli]